MNTHIFFNQLNYPIRRNDELIELTQIAIVRIVIDEVCIAFQVQNYFTPATTYERT
jgi:hypothetical protein